MDHAHLLLVEDTASLARMYETFLSDQGYKVTCAFRGTDALEITAANDVDLVLLDLNLPDMQGLDVLEKLNTQHKNIPVIIITGHGSISVAVDAMRLGACDFLVKPFNVERLYNAVKSELEKDNMTTLSPALAGFVAGDLQGEGAGDADMPQRAERTQPAPATSGERTRKDFGGFIGTSPIMLKLYEQIEAAAASQATVFITGESGTGKEVCAEAIHKHSNRADKPFIPINCAAIPRDLMESELFGHVKGAFTGAISDREGAAKLADGGTLFLDEIAEMNPDMQTKLLRFLQSLAFQKVGGSKMEKTDIRIICATNRNPVDEIRDGRFRQDLFYRLHVLPIYMPPLRDRGDDVLDIAYVLLKQYTAEENKGFQGFDGEAEAMLRSYSWPGNIRQLQNVIRNVVVMNDAEFVAAPMLPHELLHRHMSDERMIGNGRFAPYYDGRGADGFGPADLGGLHPDNIVPLSGRSGEENGAYGMHTPADIRPLAEIEREIIERAIVVCGDNIPKAAAALDVSPSTIYRKKMSWDEGDGKNGGRGERDGAGL